MNESVKARFKAVETANSRSPHKMEIPCDPKGRPLPVSEFYGVNRFDLPKLRESLPRDIFDKLNSSIQQGKKIDAEVASAVASAVKDWAIKLGATHFCHWFQPQTGLTAEKHDAFFSFDDKGAAIEKFSGSQLIQSEPDASSFPSGGMRTTFEARGYTAWDPSSPMFVMESTNGKTLCIPSAFISYHGHALDKKTGLLRSMEALNQKAIEVLHLLGDRNVTRVVPTLGAEQEYFLIDRAFFPLRPDLVMSGRTLLGGQPPKGQQLEDHYFGSIPSRVHAFMAEMELELFKLGVPVKTRHNEVAPGQYESAPIFEEANVSIDHNQLVMEILKKVARRHNFEVLLHEKPFAGLNGSGKHCNWSLMTKSSGKNQDGLNLLDPGKTPEQNLRFLVFLSAVLWGVNRHAGLLRAAIASSGNDHRLGANEAPPAIISVFLGDLLSKILDNIENGSAGGYGSEDVLKLGVSHLPEVMKDNTDRNRTSPFAFTGNKFEFRAVGSSANPSVAILFLNAAVADGLATVALRLKSKSVLDVVREIIVETKAIRFEGNNYSEDWQKEAAKRGLPNLKTSPEALKEMVSDRSKKLLSDLKIFTPEETESRYHVRLERYIKNMGIEVDSIRSIVDTQILPAALKFYGDLVQAASQAKSVGVSTPGLKLAERVAGQIERLQEKRVELENIMRRVVESEKNPEAHAGLLASDVMRSMLALRQHCDELEGMISDEYWPLPKYREMLFASV